MDDRKRPPTPPPHYDRTVREERDDVGPSDPWRRDAPLEPFPTQFKNNRRCKGSRTPVEENRLDQTPVTPVKVIPLPLKTPDRRIRNGL